mgnify:FL=1
MKIIRNTKPISDLYNGMKSGDIIINKEYQRSPGLWPNNSRSYFIDTILNEYPFPKIVLWQKIDIYSQKTTSEIIDGQQRLTTIRDYINNKFKLSYVSKKYSNKFFDDLDDKTKEMLLTYEVSLDIITSGSNEEILEIFKRINSYTLPLNNQEQRFATYQGEFKWFINELTERITPFLSKTKVLGDRDISRMLDDDLLTECWKQYLKGIVVRSTKKLDLLYKENDIFFPEKDILFQIIMGTFDFLKDNFYNIFEYYYVKPYNFYSLMGALIYNKYGFLSNFPVDSYIEKKGVFCENPEYVADQLLQMFTEINDKNENGKYSVMVKACASSTHSVKSRRTRFVELLKLIQLS